MGNDSVQRRPNWVQSAATSYVDRKVAVRLTATRSGRESVTCAGEPLLRGGGCAHRCIRAHRSCCLVCWDLSVHRSYRMARFCRRRQRCCKRWLGNAICRAYTRCDHFGRDYGIRRVLSRQAKRRCVLHQGSSRRKRWHDLLGTNTGGGLFSNYDPSASGTWLGTLAVSRWRTEPRHKSAAGLSRVPQCPACGALYRAVAGPFQEFLLRMTAPERELLPNSAPKAAAVSRSSMLLATSSQPSARGTQPSRRCEAYAQGSKGEDKPSREGRYLFKLTHRDPRFEQLATS
jgi:hypothetical protein